MLQLIPMARQIEREIDLPLFAAATRRFLSVTELNELIKGTLESRLDALWVQGEISNFRVPPSGALLLHPQRRQEPDLRGNVPPPRRGPALPPGKRPGGPLFPAR